MVLLSFMQLIRIMKLQPSKRDSFTVECSVDVCDSSIIAITGMDAHAYGSWMTKGESQKMWLRDFLAADMPNCRTMIYGYQSKLLTPHMNMLTEYGREFFAEISKVRRTEDVIMNPVRFPIYRVSNSHRVISARCFS